MATRPQIARRHQAKKLVQKRIDFWSEKSGMIEFDGKTVDSARKLAIATQELSDIESKVR